MSNKLILILFMTLGAISAKAAEIPLRYEASAKSKVAFEAVGRPSLLKIKGEGAKVRGQIEIKGTSASGLLLINLDEFDTGMGLRNRHMKEKYLETATYPTAELEIERVSLPEGFRPGTNARDLSFEGSLKLKGVTHPVRGQLDIEGLEMRTKARFEISLKDYPIGVPSYMGVTVADSVSIEATIPGWEKK